MHDEQLIRDLYSDFTKEEILKISSEFGLDHKPSDRAKLIIPELLDHAITVHPDTGKKHMSDVAYEFLAAADIINDDGEYITRSVKKVEQKPIEDITEEKTEELPTCYGSADNADPSCVKCKVLQNCLVKRVDNRPPCYGKGYDKVSDECSICIESGTCSVLVAELKGKGN